MSRPVALLEFLHNLSHPLHGFDLVFCCQTVDDAGTDDGATRPFHISHSCTETVADVLDRFLVKASLVGVGAGHGLRAVVRTTYFLC